MTLGTTSPLLYVIAALILMTPSLADAKPRHHHCPPSPSSPDVALPGSAFYPEGIAVRGDGTFFVGSIASGDIETFQQGDTSSTTFAQGELTSAVGMLVDEARGVLWVCGSRAVTLATPAGPVTETQVGVLGLDLESAAALAFHAFSGGGFCNDLAQDERGTLYITDSAGWRLMRVEAADLLSDSPAEPWLADARFALEPGEGTGLSVNGIAYTRRRLYVVNITRGELYEVKIKHSGAPGQVRTIDLGRALDGPDGLKALDHNTLVVVENFSSSLSLIDLHGDHGDVDVIASGLGDAPTTVAAFDDELWVVIGQLDRLFLGNPNPPVLPFEVVTVAQP